MAGQPTMSGQDGHLSEQTFTLLDGYFDRTCKQVQRPEKQYICTTLHVLIKRTFIFFHFMFWLVSLGHSYYDSVRREMWLSQNFSGQSTRLVTIPNVFWALLCFLEVFPWRMSRIVKGKNIKTSLLTQFKVCTISYGPSFFCFDFQRKREACRSWMQVDKQDSVIYSMDWENKVGRMFIPDQWWCAY